MHHSRNLTTRNSVCRRLRKCLVQAQPLGSLDFKVKPMRPADDIGFMIQAITATCGEAVISENVNYFQFASRAFSPGSFSHDNHLP
jgi:hypothetical protein